MLPVASTLLLVWTGPYLFIYYQFVHIVQEKQKKVTQLLDSLQYSWFYFS